MKKIKLFLCVALLGAMSFGAFSVYGHITMSADEKALLENVEALTLGENPGGGGSSVTCYDETEYAGRPYGQYDCLTLTECDFRDGYSAAINTTKRICTTIK